MNRLTQSDLNKLAARGMRVTIQPRPKNRVTIPQQDSKEVIWLHWNLQYWANEHALELQKEFVFHESRMWRFDFFLPAIKAAIEYEGIFSDISRHTTYKGYSADTDKYRSAALMGITILRYTALNYTQVLQDLNKML